MAQAVSEAFAREMKATLVRLGISQREAARRTRFGQGLISNMCLGQMPGLAKILQLTGLLGVDPLPLLSAAGYPQVGVQSRDIVLPVPANEAADVEALLLNEAPEAHRLPQAGIRVQAPAPREVGAATDYCLRVVGDSMWPHLLDGDLLGVLARTTADSGQLVIARQGDTVLLRRLREERGRWTLEAFNPMYPPLPVTPGAPDYAILGVVAWHTHDWSQGW